MIKDIPTSRLEKVVEAANTLGVKHACESCNVSPQTIKRYDNELKKRRKTEPSGIQLDTRTKDTINQTIISTKKFTSNEELAEFCDIDLNVWEAVKITTNQWNTSATFVSWQYKVEWRRISGLSIDMMLASMKEQLATYAVKPLPEYAPTIGEVALEVNIPDLHLGRLASKYQGVPYTLELARDVYMQAQRYFYETTTHLPIDTVVLMIGSDFMNVDTKNQATTSGTSQIEQTNYKESFDMAIGTAMDAIEFWRQHNFSVVVKMVAGNHDEMRVYSLGCLLEHVYANIPNISIDNSHNVRKYFVYGRNLVGFSHGNKDAKRLRSVFQSEMRPYMSQVDNVEMHIGHTHSEKVVEDFGSVIVRTIPSLAQHSDWENECGYTGNRRAQAFVWHKTKGLMGISYFTPDFLDYIA